MSEGKNFFSLSDLSSGILRELAPGISTRIFLGDQAMISVVTVTANARGEIHNHPEEQWGLLLEGSGTRIQNGEEFAVEAGDFWRTPGDVPHGFIAGTQGARILDVFSPPRKEYKVKGSGFAA